MQAAVTPGKPRRKWLLWSLVMGLLMIVAILLVSLRPALHLAHTRSNDPDSLPPTPLGHVDDASRLNQTKVHAVESLPVAIEDAERQLASLLERARASGLKVSIAGARHR